jgi:hypothetical protein
MFDRRLGEIVDRLMSESRPLADREPSRVP